jgi:hypothetical protein
LCGGETGLQSFIELPRRSEVIREFFIHTSKPKSLSQKNKRGHRSGPLRGFTIPLWEALPREGAPCERFLPFARLLDLRKQAHLKNVTKKYAARKYSPRQAIIHTEISSTSSAYFDLIVLIM